MNEIGQKPQPNLSPLVHWLETTGLVKKGTAEEMNKLADKVKGFGDALKASGLLR